MFAASALGASESRKAVLPFSFVPHAEGPRMKSQARADQGPGQCPGALKAKAFAAKVRGLSRPGAAYTLWVKLSGDRETRGYPMSFKALEETLLANPAALARRGMLRLQGRHHDLAFRVGKCRWYIPYNPNLDRGEIDLMEVTRGEFSALVRALQLEEEPAWPKRRGELRSRAYPSRGKSLQRTKGSIKRNLRESVPTPEAIQPSDFSPARD